MNIIHQELGRVSIDRHVLAFSSAPCVEIAVQCENAGFPLKLGLMGLERWPDEKRRWERFQEAAAAVGATWWSIDEDCGHDLVIRWGVHVRASRFPKGPWHYEKRIFGGAAVIKIPEIEEWLGYPLEDDQRKQVKDGPQIWAKPVPGLDPQDDP